MLKKIFLPLIGFTIACSVFANTNSVWAAQCDRIPDTRAREQCEAAQNNSSGNGQNSSSSGSNNNTSSSYCDRIPDTRAREQCEAAQNNHTNTETGTNNGQSNGSGQNSGNSGQNSGNSEQNSSSSSTNPIRPVTTDETTEVPRTAQPTSSDYKEEYGKIEIEDKIDPEYGCRTFLGLKSWDCGTELGNINGTDGIVSFVAIVASNIFDDITIIATYLILAYVIYGGYLYIFANGDTGKVATGKKALNQAFIGLAITLSASIIINTIRIILLGANGAFSENSTVNPGEMISSMIQWVIGIAGVVSVVYVVGGGIMYMTSAGDPSKLQTAKNVIKYALIGLVIVALAQSITILMTNIIKGNSSSDSQASTYIIKEDHEKNQII